MPMLEQDQLGLLANRFNHHRALDKLMGQH